MKHSLVFAIGCVVHSSFALAMELKYEELPRLLREKNRGVQASSLSVEAARERTGSLTRSFLPRVEAIGGAEHFKTGNYPVATQPYGGIEATVNVFRGGLDSL